jgi:hypothetical protein
MTGGLKFPLVHRGCASERHIWDSQSPTTSERHTGLSPTRSRTRQGPQGGHLNPDPQLLVINLNPNLRVDDLRVYGSGCMTKGVLKLLGFRVQFRVQEGSSSARSRMCVAYARCEQKRKTSTVLARARIAQKRPTVVLKETYCSVKVLARARIAQCVCALHKFSKGFSLVTFLVYVPGHCLLKKQGGGEISVSDLFVVYVPGLCLQKQNFCLLAPKFSKVKTFVNLSLLALCRSSCMPCTAHKKKQEKTLARTQNPQALNCGVA